MAKQRRRNRPKPKGKPAGGETSGRPDDAIDHRDATSDEAADESRKRDDAKRERAAKSDSKLATKGGTASGTKGTKTPPVEQPAFWFGFEVSWAKLFVTRVVLFSLLALDALLAIRHAPRYDATDFNVAHVGFLDSLGPDRVGYGVGQLVCAYLFALVVFGVGTRVVLPIATVVYAWLYFGSQLDSYQHHYLVALVLAISCFVPWQRPRRAGPVRAWAVRLLLVQLAIMYLWAAISKLDARWIDGAVLEAALSGSMRGLAEKTIGFSGMAVMVLAVELVLAATVWIKRAWVVAAPLGLLFHAGIVFTGLEIGLFAYLMVAIYALVVPDAVWERAANRFAGVGTKLRAIGDRPGMAAIAIGVAVGTAVALIVRLPNAFVVAGAIAGVPVVLATMMREPRAAFGIAHAAAIVAWLVVDRGTSVTEDYYRFWGGSQRRLGDVVTSEQAYRKLVEIAPDKEVGHFQLGRSLLSRGWTDEGLEELHTAQRVDPARARAFVEEARWLVKQNRLPEATAKARDAVAAEPGNAEAKTVLESLTNAKPVPAPKADVE